MIELKNFTFRYANGHRSALENLNLTVEDGDFVGVIGNSGAGKTTLFRILLDLLHADTGTCTIHGPQPDGTYASYDTARSEDWKRHTGAFVDTGFLIDYLTPEEYFSFLAKVNGISPSVMNERLKQFDGFMNGEVTGRNVLIRNLSMGNQQKVGIIGAMLSHPRLLILDEPFNFLDPSSQMAMKYLLESYNKDTGATKIGRAHV